MRATSWTTIQLWVDPGSSSTGTDDDANGFTDDLVGWDFTTNRNNADFTGSHGTQIASLIGAMPSTETEGDGSRGISGVAWEVSIVPIGARALAELVPSAMPDVRFLEAVSYVESFNADADPDNDIDVVVVSQGWTFMGRTAKSNWVRLGTVGTPIQRTVLPDADFATRRDAALADFGASSLGSQLQQPDAALYVFAAGNEHVDLGGGFAFRAHQVGSSMRHLLNPRSPSATGSSSRRTGSSPTPRASVPPRPSICGRRARIGACWSPTAPRALRPELRSRRPLSVGRRRWCSRTTPRLAPPRYTIGWSTGVPGWVLRHLRHHTDLRRERQDPRHGRVPTMRCAVAAFVSLGLGCHREGVPISVAGYRVPELCRTVDYRVIVDLNTRADGAPDAPELQAAIAAAGGTLATCEERYWCDEINVFLVQLPERRWACWDFALALEERVPYPLADVHYPPVPATCSCDMGWWATGELRDTGRIDR